MSRPIPVECRTNIDELRGETWPKFMYNPSVGDRVKSKNGRILKIVSITHQQIFDENMNYRGLDRGAYLEIELHQVF